MSLVILAWQISAGCGPSDLGNDMSLAKPTELSKRFEFSSARAFTFTSAQAVDRCSFILTVKGRTEVQKVDIVEGGGVISQVIATGTLAPTDVTVSNDGTVLLHSPADGRFARLDLRSQMVTEFRVPPHPWGGRVSGNVVDASATVFVAGRFGSRPIARSVDAGPAPLVDAFDKDARHVFRLGNADSVGRFIPSFSAVVTVGVYGDSIVAVRHHDASLATMSIAGALNKRDTTLTWRPMERRLKQHEFREEMWSPEWIQQGGELFQVFGVPEIEAARISRDGNVYLLRNTQATWVRARNRFLKTQGMWKVVDRRIEVRGLDGHLRAQYRLPLPTAVSFNVDREHHFITATDSGKVSVFALPHYDEEHCVKGRPFLEVKVP